MSESICCVRSCLVRLGEGVPLHQFPNPCKDSKRFQLWIQRAGEDNGHLTENFIFKNRKICHKHFEQVYHSSKGRLLKSAVPSLFLTDVKFHVFPSLESKPERFKAWVHAIGGKLETAEDYQYYKRQRICDRHFNDNCKFGNNRVGASGVPSLYLSGVKFHVFPSLETKPERFKAWVHAIGGKLEKAEDYQYYKSQRICDRHFTDNCKNRNNRVGAFGVPSLYLSEEPPEESDPLLLTPDGNSMSPDFLNTDDTRYDDTMSQDAEVIQPNAICVCCLQSFKNYIKLSVCQHLEYLYQFSETKLDLQNEAVCYYCHSYLNKIQAFNQQVKRNFKLFLHEKAINIDENQRLNTRVYNLQAHKAFIEVSIIPEETQMSHRQQVTNSNTELGTKPAQPLYYNKKKIDLKMEYYGMNSKNNLNKECKSGKENQRLENIKNAVNIMNLGGNSESSDLNTLATSTISSIASILIGDLCKEEKCEDVGTENTTDNIEQMCEYKEIVIENSEQKQSFRSIKQKDPLKRKILTIKLTEKDLNHERMETSQSYDFAKAAFRCETCLLSFNYKENLQDHLHRKHKQIPDGVVCNICEQIVPSISLKDHNKRHFTRYQCLKCLKVFSLYNEAILHYKVKHKIPKKRCKLCAYSTRSVLNFRRHIVNKHFRFPCLLCKALFKSYFTLKNHRTETHNLSAELNIKNESYLLQANKFPLVGHGSTRNYLES